MATVLKIGSKGDAVKELQKKVGATPDGIYGPQTAAAVAAYQAANNLTRDGIAGPQTLGSLQTKSSGSGTSSKNTNVPVGTKTGNYTMTKDGWKQTSGFQAYIEPQKKVSAARGFVNKLMSLHSPASALDAFSKGLKALDRLTDSDATQKSKGATGSPTSYVGERTAGYLPGISKAADNIYNKVTNTEKTFSGEVKSDAPVSRTSSEYLEVKNAPITMEGYDNQVYDSPELESSPYSMNTTNTTSTTDKTKEEPSLSLSEPSMSFQNMNMNSYNPTATNNANNAIMQFKDNLTGIRNNAWENKDSINENMIKWGNTTLGDIAASFSNPQEFDAAYSSNPNFRKNTDDYLRETGKTPEDIRKNILPLNQIDETPRTAADYIAAAGGLLPGKDSFSQQANKEMLMTAQHFAELDKHAKEANRQARVDAINELDFLREMEAKKDERLERQAELAVRKLKAEMKKAEAELEDQRFKSKDYAVGMLAKLGALRTDSNAIVGLENLEAKYNVAIQDMKRDYNFRIAEVQSDMEYKIWESTSKFNYDTLKITQNLNKSQRDVDMDLYKLKFSFQKDSMKLVADAKDRIARANEKHYANIIKANNNYEKEMFNLTIKQGLPVEIATQLLSERRDGTFPITKENVDLYNRYKTTKGGVEPAVKGQVLKTNISSTNRKKLEALGISREYLEDIREALEMNYSLEQIVKEEKGKISSSAYNLIKELLK